MRLEYLAEYHGPSPYAHAPIIVAKLELDPASLSNAAAIFQRLREAYPGWLALEPDPAVTPAVRLARCASHWALGALNEVRGFLHDAGAIETPEGTLLWLGFHEPRLSRAALELAVRALLLAGEKASPFDPAVVQPQLDALWQECKRRHPDDSARLLMQGARLLDVPVLPLQEGAGIWQYGWGTRARLFFWSGSNEDGFVARKIANSKHLSKAVLSALGVPIARHVLVDAPANLPEALQAVGLPCVTKPLDNFGGKGITAGISSMAELEAGFSHAQRFTRGPVMVEAFVPGPDYRLTVVDGQLLSAVRREASSVEGDGIWTVRALVAELNRTRSGSIETRAYLNPVALDAALEAHLLHQGLELDAVPASGQRITLSSLANWSAGGLCTDVTSQVHPQVRSMAETLAQTVGFFAAGLDYVTPDISRPWHEVGGAFIEINQTPGLDVLAAAGVDPAVLGAKVLGALPGRIPLSLAVVSASELPDMLAWLKREAVNAGLGWVCGETAGIGSLPLSLPRLPLWKRVATVLRHRTVTRALVVCTPEMLMQHGMPVDKVDEILLGSLTLPEAWRLALNGAAAAVCPQASLADIQARWSSTCAVSCDTNADDLN